MKKLLIVVDYQVDFVTGTLGFGNAIKIEDGIYNRINYYLENGYDVVFTLDTHEDSYLSTEEGTYLPVKHCIKNTNGHELYGKVKELVGSNKVFEKVISVNEAHSAKLYFPIEVMVLAITTVVNALHS